MVMCLLSSGCVPALPVRREAGGRTLTLCELSRDFAQYADQLISVRGIYYRGLRQACPQRCPTGEPWPSFSVLKTASGVRGSRDEVAFSTDERSWDAVDKLALEIANSSEKTEIWVTVLGQLRVLTRSPLGPCDWAANGFGGELVVKSISAVEVIANPHTPYDYSTYQRRHMRRGIPQSR